MDQNELKKARARDDLRSVVGETWFGQLEAVLAKLGPVVIPLLIAWLQSQLPPQEPTNNQP